MVVLMNKIKFGVVSLAITSALLTGCANKKDSDIEALNSLNSKSVLAELKEISIEARHELRILAKTQEAVSQKGMTKEQHEQKFLQATHVPDGFDKRVDFRVTDTAYNAASAVAAVAGYKIKMFGKPLANEPWVRINLTDQPLNDALKELGMQTGDSIRIEVYPPAKLIRFIYKDQ